jgi:hypothetical protein
VEGLIGHGVPAPATAREGTGGQTQPASI